MSRSSLAIFFVSFPVRIEVEMTFSIEILYIDENSRFAYTSAPAVLPLHNDDFFSRLDELGALTAGELGGGEGERNEQWFASFGDSGDNSAGASYKLSTPSKN